MSSIEEIATNKLFAIKTEKKPNRKITLRNEWDLHKKLNHPSILRIYDFYVCKDEASKMVMDLGEKTMFNMLKEKGYIEEAQMKVYFKDILLGLEYLVVTANQEVQSGNRMKCANIIDRNLRKSCIAI